MNLNTNFNLRVAINTHDLPWIDSPATGVQRRLLERDGGEVARATSVVRYAPGTQFAEHGHDGGEEFIVLEGVFEDEHGQYGPGTYVRNPPGFRHSPFSTEGCTIFVKLRHLDPAQQARVVVDTARGDWRPGLVDGLSVMPLADFGGEHTALVRWAPGTRFQPHRHHGGEEILVLDGVFQDEWGSYPAGTWLRSPHLSAHRPFSDPGCTILVKVGHLPARP